MLLQDIVLAPAHCNRFLIWGQPVRWPSLKVAHKVRTKFAASLTYTGLWEICYLQCNLKIRWKLMIGWKTPRDKNPSVLAIERWTEKSVGVKIAGRNKHLKCSGETEITWPTQSLRTPSLYFSKEETRRKRGKRSKSPKMHPQLIKYNIADKAKNEQLLKWWNCINHWPTWRFPWCKWRCPWCNGYRRRKWTRRLEFKSWTRMIALHIALIPLVKVLIQLFSFQL